jgi:hypothetical protein
MYDCVFTASGFRVIIDGKCTVILDICLSIVGTALYVAALT